MKILINALSGIGDALMFTPALQKLREFYPEARIDALVMYKGVKELYQRLPEADNALFFDFMKEGPVKSFQFVLSLRKKYDVSFNVYPSNRKEYNVINYLIGAESRAGVRYLRADRENLGFLNNVTVVEDDAAHNVEENIRMVEAFSGKKVDRIPNLKFPLSDGEKKNARDYIEERGFSENDLLIGFHPGCSTLKNHIMRRWAPDKFAELADKLAEKNNAAVFLFGGPDEKELRETILRRVKYKDRVISADTGSLIETVAVMSRMNLFVTNDSGLMHIAAALGLKIAAIIGPTSPAYIHPWKTEYKIISKNLECMPCFIYSPKPLTCYRTDVKFKCLVELSVDSVYRQVAEMIEE